MWSMKSDETFDRMNGRDEGRSGEFGSMNGDWASYGDSGLIKGGRVGARVDEGEVS